MLDQMNYLARLSQEHGILKVAQNQFKNFNIGDLVEIIGKNQSIELTSFNKGSTYWFVFNALSIWSWLFNFLISTIESRSLENTKPSFL